MNLPAQEPPKLPKRVQATLDDFLDRNVQPTTPLRKDLREARIRGIFLRKAAIGLTGDLIQIGVHLVTPAVRGFANTVERYPKRSVLFGAAVAAGITGYIYQDEVINYANENVIDPMKRIACETEQRVSNPPYKFCSDTATSAVPTSITAIIESLPPTKDETDQMMDNLAFMLSPDGTPIQELSNIQGQLKEKNCKGLNNKILDQDGINGPNLKQAFYRFMVSAPEGYKLNMEKPLSIEIRDAPHRCPS